jgi:hypothetical protein
MSHTRRIFVLVAAIGTLAACGQSGRKMPSNDAQWQKAGWHYRFDKADSAGIALYRFRDNSNDGFAALCSGKPMFIVTSTGYDRLARTFSVEIDDRRWALSTEPDEHSNSLFIADPQFVDFFAHAKRRIAYQVGKTWAVEFTPAPMLGRLISECRARPQNSPPSPPRSAT